MQPSPEPTTVARPRAWTVDDVAQYLQVHHRTVIRMCERGQLPHLKLGKLYRFDPARVTALFDGDAVHED